MSDKPKITGQQAPTTSNTPKMLTKEEITFELDEDGKAISQEVRVEVYDRAYDDEIFGTTMELDNALNMHDSLKGAFKKLSDTQNKEVTKLTTQVKDLEALSSRTKDQDILLVNFKKRLKLLQDEVIKLLFEYERQVQMIDTKIKESRKDLVDLDILRKEKIDVKLIKAVPCTVTEAYKYFNKRMYKDKDDVWIEPSGDDDTGYISHLLAEKVIQPSLSVQEWDNAKPFLRMSIKECISEISYYTRPSPKEVLVERRRSEKIKNFVGEHST